MCVCVLTYAIAFVHWTQLDFITFYEFWICPQYMMKNQYMHCYHGENTAKWVITAVNGLASAYVSNHADHTWSRSKCHALIALVFISSWMQYAENVKPTKNGLNKFYCTVFVCYLLIRWWNSTSRTAEKTERRPRGTFPLRIHDCVSLRRISLCNAYIRDGKYRIERTRPVPRGF